MVTKSLVATSSSCSANMSRMNVIKPEMLYLWTYYVTSKYLKSNIGHLFPSHAHDDNWFARFVRLRNDTILIIYIYIFRTYD